MSPRLLPHTIGFAVSPFARSSTSPRRLSRASTTNCAKPPSSVMMRRRPSLVDLHDVRGGEDETGRDDERRTGALRDPRSSRRWPRSHARTRSRAASRRRRTWPLRRPTRRTTPPHRPGRRRRTSRHPPWGRCRSRELRPSASVRRPRAEGRARAGSARGSPLYGSPPIIGPLGRVRTHRPTAERSGGVEPARGASMGAGWTL